MINQCLTIRIPRLKSSLLTGKYFDHSSVGKGKKKGPLQQCAVVDQSMSNNRDPQLTALLLTDIYPDHSSVEQGENKPEKRSPISTVKLLINA